MGGVGVELDICQGCEMQGCGAWKLLEEEEQACCFDLSSSFSSSSRKGELPGQGLAQVLSQV